MKLSVTQKSNDGTLKHHDDHAFLQDFGSTLKISYDEKDGSLVTLDLEPQRVILRRRGEWNTLGDFKKNGQSTLHVVNEHGTLIFDVMVLSMKFEKNSFYMMYQICQDDEIIDTHEYLCTWEPEV